MLAWAVELTVLLMGENPEVEIDLEGPRSVVEEPSLLPCWNLSLAKSPQGHLGKKDVLVGLNSDVETGLIALK